MKKQHGIFCVAATAVLAVTLTACGGTGARSDAATPSSGGGAQSVTIYSADGLGDWYKTQFAAFTKQTGIDVNYVEAGSSEVVNRVEKERSNPQADVLVTLPPFIQQADKDGILGDLGVDTSAIPAADKDSAGHWTAMVNNYLCFIASPTASPAPSAWKDLLDPQFKGKLQYSTPGQAGDGTAVLIELQHLYGKQGALDYLRKLQVNNVGPSSSTGKLQPKVSSGQLLVANGDLQMNLMSIQANKGNFKVFFPAGDAGAKSTVALPYDMGLTSSAPHAENGKKLVQFLLSQPVQESVSSGALGIPVRSDVHPSDANATLLQQSLTGVDVYHPDWNKVLAELPADVAAYTAAIGS